MPKWHMHNILYCGLDNIPQNAYKLIGINQSYCIYTIANQYNFCNETHNKLLYIIGLYTVDDGLYTSIAFIEMLATNIPRMNLSLYIYIYIIKGYKYQWFIARKQGIHRPVNIFIIFVEQRRDSRSHISVSAERWCVTCSVRYSRYDNYSIYIL